MSETVEELPEGPPEELDVEADRAAAPIAADLPGRPAALEDLRGNRLLAGLPAGEQERLLPELVVVDLPFRALVHDVDRPITHVWFPLDGVASLVSLVDGRVAVEVAAVGREGMVGLPAFLGAATSPHTVYTQVAGRALRLEVGAMERSSARDGDLHQLLHRYAQAVVVTLAQNVACNRLHPTEARAARWLLMTADRVGASEFTMTQAFLSQMLGVRRPTVSQTASALAAAGLIAYTRGHVTVLDREGLHAAACDCYDVISRAFA